MTDNHFQKTLDLVLDPTSGVRTQDASRIISSACRGDVGRLVAWSWLRARWEDLAGLLVDASYMAQDVGQAVHACAADFTEETELAELEAFYEDQKTRLGAGRAEVERGIDEARANVEWSKRNLQAITRWLEDKANKL